MFEEINANPCTSVLPSEIVTTSLVVPVDQVIVGVGIPLAVQLITTLPPSSISSIVLLDGLVMTADAIESHHESNMML